jgi:hypothetical protein
MTQTDEHEQRHPIFASQVVSVPDDYPEPKAGPATRLALATPDQEPVGVLIYNEKGLAWTPADTEDLPAQEHAAELLAFLRGHRGQGSPLEAVVEGIREAYVGDFAEDKVRFVPAR